jgi:hypothetical protein
MEPDEELVVLRQQVEDLQAKLDRVLNANKTTVATWTQRTEQAVTRTKLLQSKLDAIKDAAALVMEAFEEVAADFTDADHKAQAFENLESDPGYLFAKFAKTVANDDSPPTQPVGLPTLGIVSPQ